MSPMRYFGWLFAVLAASLSPTSAPAANDCPEKIAIVDSGIISPAIGEVMKTVYAELGCSLTFEPVPGLRGIQWFNSKEVDGELMRMPAAEASYNRSFVRSSAPLFSLTYSLWLHPSQTERRTLPIGYTLGVIWHNEYIKGKRTAKFHTSGAMIEAYNTGQISGILIADLSALDLATKGTLSPRPVKAELIASSPMYHYLGQEFAPFMKRFSTLVKASDPFAIVATMQK